MNFTDYAQKAIDRFSLTGYNNLGRELGLTKSAMSIYRAGKATPSDEIMIKLAELAGMPKEEALIDLNLWRSKNDPKRHEIWLRISKMIGCFITSLLFFNALTPNTQAKTSSIDNVYYEYKYVIVY